MEKEKYALFADNKAVYIGTWQQLKTWRENDMLRDVRHDYLYNIEKLDGEKEKALKEAAADGYIFLYYSAQ